MRIIDEDDLIFVFTEEEVVVFSTDGEKQEQDRTFRIFSGDVVSPVSYAGGSVAAVLGDERIQICRILRLMAPLEEASAPSIATVSLVHREITSGAGSGEFLSPTYLAKGPSGKLFIVDAGNDRIEVFSADEWRFVTKFGRLGSRLGEFRLRLPEEALWPSSRHAIPSGDIAIDSSGNIYVLDTFNWRIQKFGP